MADQPPKPIDMWVRLPDTIEFFSVRLDKPSHEPGIVAHWFKQNIVATMGDAVTVDAVERIGDAWHIMIDGFRHGTRKKSAK